ncbi:GCN5 family acetyltransferase [Rothia sp. 32237D007AR]
MIGLLVSTSRPFYHYFMDQAELKILEQTQDYVSPFEYGTSGFNNDWWHGRAGKIGDTSLGGFTYLQLCLNGTEIGRAEITLWDLSDSYIGIDEVVKVREIWFFEIREEYRNQGFGAEFARLLIEAFPDRPLIAFSEGADDFWRSAGWHYYPRKDGETMGIRKLFISRKI